jgi:hypothetical protein
MNVSELMILALTDLVSAAPKKELQDEETSKSAINYVKVPLSELHQCHMQKPS